MVATTNAIAKIAAVVAGLGLVAMSFASFAAPAKAATAADLQTQINALLAQIAAMQGGSASASASFTMDQTLGSSGAEVTALQNWLISKGYSIPAGATGYFGAQTKSALAAWQAANGVSPAAGYFGPITRAKVNAMAGGMTTGGSSTDTGGLSGGEADLRNFDLTSGDTLRESDTNKEIAVAQFDVKNGDARVQRVTLELTPVASATYSQHPWDYIDTLYVYSGSKKVGSVDAGSKSAWTKEDKDSGHGNTYDFYTIDVPVNGVLKEGDNAELSIRADAQSNIDDSDAQNQSFNVDVDDNGIRAVDSEGIQQYTGDTSDTVTLDFDGADNGDLTVRKASDTPTAGTLVVDNTDTSDEFDVLKFQIKNSQDGDATINDLTVHVATSTVLSGGKTIKDVIRKATLTADGKDFTGKINANGTIDFDNIDTNVSGNDTADYTVSVTLNGSDHYTLPFALTFSVGHADIDAEGADSGDQLVDGTDVSGTATGFAQTLALNGGISVAGNSTNGVLTYNSNSPASSYGTFTVKFDVTANGDDVYVPKTITTTAAASTTSGVVVDTGMLASTTSSTVTLSLTTTADSDNGSFYVVHDGDTETFTATVTIDANQTADFQVGLDMVRFSTGDAQPVTAGALQSIDVDQTNSDFHTDPLHIPNN